MAGRPQPSFLAGERGSRSEREGGCSCWIVASAPDISSSSDNPLWDKGTFLSFFIHRALSPFHRLPEKHFLSQSRPPLLSSRAQQLQSAPSSRTQILSPIALQPAHPVHVRSPHVEPHAAPLVHQRTSGVSLLTPVHQPASRKRQVGDRAVVGCTTRHRASYFSVSVFSF